MCTQGDCCVGTLGQDVISVPRREASGDRPHRCLHWAMQLTPGMGRNVCSLCPGLWSSVMEDEAGRSFRSKQASRLP